VNADVLVGQEIGQDTGHHHIQARRITDDGHDFVSHCDDEVSQSSPDDFSLPRAFPGSHKIVIDGVNGPDKKVSWL